MAREISKQEKAYIGFARADITRRFAKDPDAIVGRYGVMVVTRAEERPQQKIVINISLTTQEML